MALLSGWLAIELLGLITVVIAGFYIYFKHVLYNYWSKKGVVHMHPTVPMGNLASVIRGKLSIGEFFANCYAKYKANRFFGVYTFHKPSLVITDPDLIRVVLTKEFSHFHDRGLYCNEKVDPLSGHLFFLPGAKWKNLRGKLSPTFTSGKMKRMFGTVKECGDALAGYLENMAEAEEVVEMKDILGRFSTDVIVSTAFGISCNSLKNPNSEFRYWGRKAFEPRQVWNALTLFAPKFMDFFAIPFTDKGVSKFFINAFANNVSHREDNKVIRHDFMDLLIQLMKKGYVNDDDGKEPPHISESSSGKIDLLEGAAQAFVFFLAGFETSSSTVTHCLYELAVNKNIQEKLREDIDRGLRKSGGLNYESLSEMPYLHKVVSETLRKYPSVPLLNRVCTEDIDLATTDLHVHKGDDVVIPILGIHQDPDIYPEPEKFDPERFSEENIASRHPYAYLPFGEGPRICIGMRFGLVQTKIALISVLSKYRFKLGPKTVVPLKWDPGSIVMMAKGGVHLQIQRR